MIGDLLGPALLKATHSGSFYCWVLGLRACSLSVSRQCFSPNLFPKNSRFRPQMPHPFLLDTQTVAQYPKWGPTKTHMSLQSFEYLDP